MITDTFVDELSKLPSDIAIALHRVRIANDGLQQHLRLRGIEVVPYQPSGMQPRMARPSKPRLVSTPAEIHIASVP